MNLKMATGFLWDFCNGEPRILSVSFSIRASRGAGNLRRITMPSAKLALTDSFRRAAAVGSGRGSTR